MKQALLEQLNKLLGDRAGKHRFRIEDESPDCLSYCIGEFGLEAVFFPSLGWYLVRVYEEPGTYWEPPFTNEQEIAGPVTITQAIEFTISELRRDAEEAARLQEQDDALAKLHAEEWQSQAG